MQTRVTIDELIAELQARKAQGVPGTTVVAVAGRDNNGEAGFANFELAPRMHAVGKAEYDKGWTLGKFVSRGGVPVFVLG